MKITTHRPGTVNMTPENDQDRTIIDRWIAAGAAIGMGRDPETMQPIHCQMTIAEMTGKRIEAGFREDRERGTIGGIDGARVTVQWDSGIVTTQPMAALDDLAIL